MPPPGAGNRSAAAWLSHTASRSGYTAPGSWQSLSPCARGVAVHVRSSFHVTVCFPECDLLLDHGIGRGGSVGDHVQPGQGHVQTDKGKFSQFPGKAGCDPVCVQPFPV